MHAFRPDDPRRRRPPHAGGVGAPRVLPGGLARAPVPLGRRDGRRRSRVRRRDPHDRRLRSGARRLARGGRPARGGPHRRRGGRDADRRLLGAGHGPHLRDRPRGEGGSGLPLQLLGRQVPALRGRRPPRCTALRPPRRPPIRRPIRARGRRYHGGRGGHPRHDRAVPPQPEPEPGHVPGRRRGGPARLPRSRGDRVAPPRARRGPRHRRPRRQRGGLRGAAHGPRPDGVRPPESELRATP